jgi:hypothetical protein
VTTNITQRTGTNGWQSAFAASSATTFSVSTADPSLSTTLAPVLTIVLGFGKQSGLQAVSRGPARPHRRPEAAHTGEPPSGVAEIGGAALDLADSASSSVHTLADENSSADVAEAESSSPGVADAESGPTDLPAESGSSSEDSAPEQASESSTSRHRERRLRLVDAAAASEESEPRSPEASPEPTPAAERAAEPDPAAEAQPSTEPQPVKPAPSNRLEMTIDSLPHHDLTAPIPIYIDPLGDTVFTATVANLDIMATGNSIGEALVLLKEQIEFVYGDLTRRHKQSPEQMTMLKMLNTYIAPKGTKPAWL